MYPPRFGQGEVNHTKAAALSLAGSGPASLAKAAGARNDRMIFRRAGNMELHRHSLILVQKLRHLRLRAQMNSMTGKQIESDGTLDLRCASGPPAPTKYAVAME